MTQPVTLTPEQFAKLLEAAKPADKTAGLGAPPMKTVGFGVFPADAPIGPLEAGIYAMLAGGSPRLALAKALGGPLAPYLINFRATFPDSTTNIVPDVGS